MHFPARNQPSLGSALMKKLLPGRLPGSMGISSVCRGTRRVVCFLFTGVKDKACSYINCSLPKAVPKLSILSAEARMGCFILSPAIQAERSRGARMELGDMGEILVQETGKCRNWYSKSPNEENQLKLPLVNPSQPNPDWPEATLLLVWPTWPFKGPSLTSFPCYPKRIAGCEGHGGVTFTLNFNLFRKR